jgi:GH25 family lysozyme M1 (1,4-beta-N-acetylmuramidase)
MVLFGLDISHHQSFSLNLVQCKKEGVSYIFIKSTEGSSFIDPAFAANLAEAKQAGLLVAAYHYVKSNATALAQVQNVARVVPKDVPVIPDVEANSGGVALLRSFVGELQHAGYHVPLTYLPRWYWQQIGSPDLTGLPALWSSRYPDNVVGTMHDEYADVPATYWNGYGNLSIAVLQFTSSARVAGYQPLDANAFRGTIEDMKVLLGVKTVALKDEFWTVTDYDNNKTLPVDALTMLGNLYQMQFYGSKTAPWNAPSEVAMLKDLVAREAVQIDEAVLAQKMHDLGIGGVTVEQIKSLLNELTLKAIGS